MRKCVVFDFDCTITKRHFYHFLNSSKHFKKLYDINLTCLRQATKPYFNGLINNISESDLNLFIDIIMGGQQRLDMLKLFFYKLRSSGIVLHISSRGTYKQIVNCLRLLNLDKYFTLVNACGFTSLIDINKNLYPGFKSKTDKKHTCDKVSTPSTPSGLRGKVAFFHNYIFNRYNIIVYIDDDHKENKIMKEHGHKYYFINTLVKDLGGGINERETRSIENIFMQYIMN